MEAIKPDSRYSINLEYCGYLKAKWVLRFCGKCIGAFNTKRLAEIHAIEYDKQRLPN